MGPSWDVYVWVGDDRDAVSPFVERFVDVESAGSRLDAFLRVCVDQVGTTADGERVAELGADGTDTGAVTIYVPAVNYTGANITATADGSFSLGLSVVDPLGAPEVEREAARLLVSLREQYSARDGRAGIELAPATSGAEWEDNEMVMLRTAVGTRALRARMSTRT